MIKRTLGLVVFCGCLTGSGVLLAHHSVSGIYDVRKEGRLTGTVSKMEMTNPHGLLFLEVKNKDGSITTWKLSTGSAITLARLGIFGYSGPNHVKSGDKVTVTYYPTRNNRPLGFLTTIKMPDGHVIILKQGLGKQP